MTAPDTPDPAPYRMLMVCERFLPHVGGLELQALALARELAHRGIPVEMMTRRFSRMPAAETIEGVSVSRVRAVNAMGPARLPFALGQVSFLAAASAFLVRNRRRFDLLHVHGLGPSAGPMASLARRLGKRTLVTIATARSGESGLRGRRFARLRQAANRAFDRYLALSREIEDELLEDGIPAERIVRLPNFVDTDRFRPVDPGSRTRLRRQLWPQWPAEAVVIITMNRLEARKGVALLLEAAATLDRELPVRIAIAGDGEERGRLEALTDRLALGDRVLFHGTVRTPADYLAAADIFALPSFSEGLPNGVLEALASGLPALLTRIGGVVDIVGDADAEIVEPGQVEPLARGLERLVTRPAQRREMGERGRRIITERFATGPVVDRYCGLCEQIMRPHAGAATA